MQDPAIDHVGMFVGGSGGGWIIDHLRRYVGTEEDRAARARARDDVWAVKGVSALGSSDARERVAAMDLMGVQRQLLFPNTTLRRLRRSLSLGSSQTTMKLARRARLAHWRRHEDKQHRCR